MKSCKFYITIFLSLTIGFSNTNNLKLGRDNNPKTTYDISKLKLLYKKTFWSSISILGPRNLSKLVYPKAITYMDVQNAVAFTIDDGFCGIDNPEGNMIEDVRNLLDKYNAEATFFITGSHTFNTSEYDVDNLLIDGHELANHNMYDIAYNKHTESDFEKDLIDSKQILLKYTSELSKWYRPPHAKMSKNMHKVIDKHGLKLVLGDVFANDTSIPDPNYIAKYILKKVKPGSIIIIHMPEKGVREWNLKAIDLILDGLNKKGLDIVTLSKLEELSTN